MRRSELAGVRRDMLDLNAGVLRVEDTRVIVAGRSHDSDGKTTAGRRGISLDMFTCAELAKLLDLLDRERSAFGSAYPDHRLLMVNEEGRPLHPDTITARFNRLVDRAGIPHIRLHDVRHTYATLAMDLGIDPKMLSDRIGHANTSVTLQIYTHRSAGRDQTMAQTLGEMFQTAIRGSTTNPASDRNLSHAEITPTALRPPVRAHQRPGPTRARAHPRHRRNQQQPAKRAHRDAPVAPRSQRSRGSTLLSGCEDAEVGRRRQRSGDRSVGL